MMKIQIQMRSYTDEVTFLLDRMLSTSHETPHETPTTQ